MMMLQYNYTFPMDSFIQFGYGKTVLHGSTILSHKISKISIKNYNQEWSEKYARKK